MYVRKATISLGDKVVINNNKAYTGHARNLYVGNEGDRLFEFFEDFNINCFFCKLIHYSFIF